MSPELNSAFVWLRMRTPNCDWINYYLIDTTKIGFAGGPVPYNLSHFMFGIPTLAYRLWIFSPFFTCYMMSSFIKSGILANLNVLTVRPLSPLCCFICLFSILVEYSTTSLSLSELGFAVAICSWLYIVLAVATRVRLVVAFLLVSTKSRENVDA